MISFSRDLNSDCLEHILEYLDAKSLFTLQETLTSDSEQEIIQHAILKFLSRYLGPELCNRLDFTFKSGMKLHDYVASLKPYSPDFSSKTLPEFMPSVYNLSYLLAKNSKRHA